MFAMLGVPHSTMSSSSTAYPIGIHDIDYAKQETTQLQPGGGYTTSTTTNTGLPGTVLTTKRNFAKLDPETLTEVMQCVTPGCQILLYPIAAPSAMGFAAFFASTWILSTWLCSWWGAPNSLGNIFPFVAIFGGVGQIVAGTVGYMARDNMATVFHWAWGSFYFAFGLLEILKLFGLAVTLDRYAKDESFGMWLVCVAAISWCCFLAGFARDIITLVTLFLLSSGTTVLFAGYFAGSETTIKVAAYILMVSALAALYRSLYFMLEEAFQRLPSWIPNYKTPWERQRPAVYIPINEPGIKKGQ